MAGKTASCAAMALTLGTYAVPQHPVPVAVATVAVLTGVNYRGIAKTARLARVLVADLRAAIGFSSVAVLAYYALANASAFTLAGRLRPLTVLGFTGCLLLALTLPTASVVAGASRGPAGPNSDRVIAAPGGAG